MKRFLLAILGMLLLGAAGLIVLHQVVDAPTQAMGQAGAGGPPLGGAAGGPGFPAASHVPGGVANYKDLVPALLEALADADGDVRLLAAATLLKVGPDAVPPLTEALKSKDREMRANAAYVLGQLGDAAAGATPALAKTLKDPDTDVRRRVAYALHNIISSNEAGAGLAAPEGGGSAPGSVPIGATMMRLSAGRANTTGDPGLLLPVAKTEKPR